MTLSQSFSAKGRRRGSPPACVHPTICPSLHVTPPLSSNPNSARVTNCSVKHASCREESKEWALFQQSLSLSLSLSLPLVCCCTLALHLAFSFIPLSSSCTRSKGSQGSHQTTLSYESSSLRTWDPKLPPDQTSLHMIATSHYKREASNKFSLSLHAARPQSSTCWCSSPSS